MKPEQIAREQAKWCWTGAARPPFAIAPGPDEESVWDYPRPPRVDPARARLRVEFAGKVVADTMGGLRVLETAAPPVYYFPPEDVRFEWLQTEPGTSFCEWKGVASYLSLSVGQRRSKRAAWCYPEPSPAFEAIRGHIAFHAGRVDACFVGDARVTPQPGDYYGGWVSPGIVGPFKGERGTEGW